MKPRILMVLDMMQVGGIEKAALSMLSVLPPDQYDLTVLLMGREGEWVKAIPGWVTVQTAGMSEAGRYEFTHGRKAALRRHLRQGRWAAAVAVVLRHLHRCLTLPRSHWKFHEMRAALGKHVADPGVYDCAIAFHDAIHVVWFVLHRVRARRRIGWFHTDYPIEALNPATYKALYTQFDILLACSTELASRMNARLPELPRKIQYFPYIIDCAACRTRAQQAPAFPDVFAGVRILSVGRLEAQKGFDMAVRVCARLIQAGCPIH
jgi:glycosyltransferase involved in cell wall biosynthesis